MDTIFAEATPPGRGGVSIIRLSGPEAAAIADTLSGSLGLSRTAVLRTLRDNGDVIDRALVFLFEAGHSFTGETVVEFHLHGAPVVVRRLSKALRHRGARLAGAGEFTRRAFLNGKLDLTEVQGLSDLLLAETEAQRVLAIRNAGGELGRLADGWRVRLIRAGALVMASLDFPGEDALESVPREVHELTAGIVTEIRQVMNGYAGAAALRRGLTVAVIGPPNAGKSSFVNRIAQREVALVTDTPGTTRDALEVALDLGGMAVTLVDTAGLRDASDPVEMLGIARARQRASDADLRLHLSEDGFVDPKLWQPGDFAVRTKADHHGGRGISSHDGTGIVELMEKVREALAERVADAGLVSHEMQIARLGEAVDSLSDLVSIPPEMIAEQIRDAQLSLEGLVGRVDIEDYLDVVFSAFCIGK